MSNTPSSTFKCLNQVTITFCGDLAILERHCLFHSVFQRKQLSSQAAEHLASWFVLRNKIGREWIAAKQVRLAIPPYFFITICGEFWLGLMTIHIYAPVCFLKSHTHSNLHILRVKPRIKGVTSSMFYYYSVWGFFFYHKIIHKHMLLVLGTNFSTFFYLLISLFSCVHSYLLEVLKYIATATSTPSTAENLLNIRYYTKVLAVLHLPPGMYYRVSWDVLDQRLSVQVTQWAINRCRIWTKRLWHLLPKRTIFI